MVLRTPPRVSTNENNKCLGGDSSATFSSSSGLSPSTSATVASKASQKVTQVSPMGDSNPISSHSSATMRSDFETSNRFTVLSDIDENNSDSDNDDEMPSATQNSHIRPPPIVLHNDENCVQLIIKELRKKFPDRVIFKYMSVGVKISARDMLTYNKILSDFKSKNRQFYSHDVRKIPPKKFLISGLPDFTGVEDDVKAEISEIYGLQPIEIAKIPPKNRRYSTHCLYVASFEKGATNIRELKKIEYLYNTKIFWDYYKQKPRGPTLCENCFLYGHGSRNCRMKTRCGKCGGLHNTEKCPPNTQIKCRNCNGGHLAQDLSCPARDNFIRMRNARSNINRRSGPPLPLPEARPPAPPPTSLDDFPMLPRNSIQRTRDFCQPGGFQANPSNVSNKNWGNQQQPRSGSFGHNDAQNQPTQSTNNVDKRDQRYLDGNSRPTIQPGNSSRHFSSQNTRQTPLNGRNGNVSQSNLFTSQELLDISMELLSGLRNCRSKIDQLQLMFNIIVKYIDD
uniref:Pre-C2HC domain-containing protein n=1 Tax=Phlebotomus papatasi TaxID=29031 RepID=A0A1B0DII4_PHLPP